MGARSLALMALILASGAALCASDVRFNLPGVDQGYAPRQPIEFSHRLHCGELEMRCLYCHGGAERSRHAALPSASVCMNCHRLVTSSTPLREGRAAASAHERGSDAPGPVSPELEKLYAAVGYDPATHGYRADGERRSIEWIQVHDLPDFVHFDHRRHVNAGATCQRCHGPVEQMERIAQVSSLTMGWCLDCHRAVNRGEIAELPGRSASTDCGACHY